MKTKQLDLEIERLKMLNNRNELTETGVELLNELIDVKKQLTLTDVVQRSELLLAVICEYNRINTYTEIKKVEAWLEKWDSK